MMSNENIEIFRVLMSHDACWGKYRAWIRGIDREKREGYIASLIWQPIGPGQIAESTFMIEQEQAQQLIDDLWGSGLRPSRISSGSDVIDAQKDHIESLRKSQDALHGLVERVTKAKR